MTWGSNASFDDSTCRFCGRPDVDDTDDGYYTSHERACSRRWINRPWVMVVGPIVIALNILAVCIAGAFKLFGGGP